MAKDKIQVLDPYTNEMVDPDPNILSHRIAVAAQEAAMANAKTTSLDATDPDAVVGPTTTSGVEVVPTQDAPGTSRNAGELAALGIENAENDADKKKGK